MTQYADSAEQQHINRLVEAIEFIRTKRKRSVQRHLLGKRFSQDELCNIAYPSYKNLLLGRTQRLPDRSALMQIADYLECTPSERNTLLRIAQYSAEDIPVTQWRKQITILIASVFTAMSPTLDLEDAAGVMRSLWASIETIVASHRGLVADHSGNILLALWSVETTHEDDPAQAIHAALAVQAELQKFQAKSQIGIHTGPTLLQRGKHGQVEATGDTLNVTSHLSQIAPQDNILLSHSTYSHLRGLVDASSIETSLPLAVYRLERLKSISEPILLRGALEVETSLIGRESELTLLRGSLDTAIQGCHSQVITIVADAGIGKSRLLYEFDGWLHQTQRHTVLFKGRASQSSQEIPYSLLRSVLGFRFQVADDDFAETACQKVEAGIVEFIHDAEAARKAAHILCHLLSFNLNESPYIRNALSDAQEFFEIALAHLIKYFKAIAEHHTVVMMFEDLHWADESSLLMLSRLLTALSRLPVLTICTARPVSRHQHLTLESDLAPHIVLDLRPLSVQDSYHLLDELLVDVQPVPEKLQNRIVTSSSGNPLYIEELVKMLKENGTLLHGAEQWRMSDEQVSTMYVPTTLIGLLQARFDNLAPTQQRLLQGASVFGRIFWDGGIRALWKNAAEETDIPLPDLIAELCRQKLIYRQHKSTFRGYTEFTFKHALLSDVIYGTLLKQNRLTYHAIAANWLMTVATRNQRLDEYAGLIAFHFKHADLVDEAANWYQRAGKAAAARFANSEALTYLTFALELLPVGNESERYSLLATRERVNDALGLRDDQAADLSAMLGLAKSLQDAFLQVEALVRQMNHAYLVGNTGEVAELAREAIELGQSIGAHTQQASSYVMLGNVLWDQGDHAAAQVCFDNALLLASADSV